MDNSFALKIDQSGVINCKLCGKRIEWKYKVEGMWMTNGRMATAVDSKPSRGVSAIFTENGKVKFWICCDQCTYCTETEPMNLINE